MMVSHKEKIIRTSCRGLVQDANWWGKPKELLILEEVLKKYGDLAEKYQRI